MLRRRSQVSAQSAAAGSGSAAATRRPRLPPAAAAVSFRSLCPCPAAGGPPVGASSIAASQHTSGMRDAGDVGSAGSAGGPAVADAAADADRRQPPPQGARRYSGEEVAAAAAANQSPVGPVDALAAIQGAAFRAPPQPAPGGRMVLAHCLSPEVARCQRAAWACFRPPKTKTKPAGKGKGKAGAKGAAAAGAPAPVPHPGVCVRDLLDFSPGGCLPVCLCVCSTLSCHRSCCALRVLPSGE